MLKNGMMRSIWGIGGLGACSSSMREYCKIFLELPPLGKESSHHHHCSRDIIFNSKDILPP